MEQKLPLFIVTGSSGSGKTYVMNELRKSLPDFVVFDLDNLRGFIDYNDWPDVLNIWLRFARNIAESGKMTILCGTAMTWDVEKCVDFSYFRHVYYLNLHCDDETREKRLLERNWSNEMIQEYKNFAKWLIENADKAYDPPMPTVDSTVTDVSEVAAQIKNWVLTYA
jgi:dephospho-CoA kinase